MSGWQAKRFWTEVEVVPEEGGFAVRLDARPLRSPAKRPLRLPTRALADWVAEEWAAVEKIVDPQQMPATRSANAAIDKVDTQRAEVADLIVEYGESDLLCYRAEEPEALVAVQAAGWDPLLAWAAARHAAPLAVTRGVVPVAQPTESLRRLAAAVHGANAFQLAALHDLVSLSGSLVLGLAATDPAFDAGDLWRLSRIDEDWQIALWGADDEAAEAAARRRADFLHAHRFHRLASSCDA